MLKEKENIERWAILIDMEGFSELWHKEDQVLRSLGELMRSIFRIGRMCFPDSPERLFAHQISDGFLVVSDFGEDNLERAITIAVALMQHVAATGRLTKAAISEGELSDIQSCYPREVLNELESDHRVSLRMGLMTIFPIMGTALIRAAKVAKTSPSGPLLIIEKSKATRIPPHIPLCEVQNSDQLSIDWVNMNSELLSKIQSEAGLSQLGSEKLKELLATYCTEHKLPEKWVNGVRTYLGVV